MFSPSLPLKVTSGLNLGNVRSSGPQGGLKQGTDYLRLGWQSQVWRFEWTGLLQSQASEPELRALACPSPMDQKAQVKINRKRWPRRLRSLKLRWGGSLMAKKRDRPSCRSPCCRLFRPSRWRQQPGPSGGGELGAGDQRAPPSEKRAVSGPRVGLRSYFGRTALFHPLGLKFRSQPPPLSSPAARFPPSGQLQALYPVRGFAAPSPVRHEGSSPKCPQT